MTAAPKRKGRPPGPALPPERRRDETIQLRATKAEKALFARLGGNDWFRDVLAVEQRKLEWLERS